MKRLHVRSVPDELCDRLRTLAQAEQRSLSAQVILLLDKAIEDEARLKEQTQIWAEIRRRRFTPPSTAPDIVEMLREDRER